MGFMLPHPFRTLLYSGVWLPFDGQRGPFRALVQDFLRFDLEDPNGELKVEKNGPFWFGKKKIELSYSHSKSFGVLVYSEKIKLGVDAEDRNRSTKNPMTLAKRFFHASEVTRLNALKGTDLKDEFLRLWTQKESYAKLTRLGLVGTIDHELSSLNHVRFESLPLAPGSVLATLCYGAEHRSPTQTG